MKNTLIVIMIMALLGVGYFAYQQYSRVSEIEELREREARFVEELNRIASGKEQAQEVKDSLILVLSKTQDKLEDKDAQIADLQVEMEIYFEEYEAFTDDEAVAAFNEFTDTLDVEPAKLTEAGNVITPMERIRISNDIMLSEHFLTRELELQGQRMQQQAESMQALQGLYANCLTSLEVEQSTSELMAERMEAREELYEAELHKAQMNTRMWQAGAGLALLLAIIF